jgi:hypothetical protein
MRIRRVPPVRPPVPIIAAFDAVNAGTHQRVRAEKRRGAGAADRGGPVQGRYDQNGAWTDPVGPSRDCVSLYCRVGDHRPYCADQRN